MIKNIGKAVLWGMLYTFASTIGILVALVSVIVQNLDMFDLESDAFFELWMEKIMEAVVPGTCVAGIICIIGYCVYKRIRQYPVELTQITFTRSLFCFSLGAVFNLIITYALEFLWEYLPAALTDSATDATSHLLSDSFHWAFLLFAVGIITPIAEEIIFRHGVCRTVARSNRQIAIFLSAIVFGLAHGNIIQGLYTCALGIMCAVVLLNSDNLWYPIFIHMGLNSTSVMAGAFTDVAMGNLVFLIVGFIALLICATMLIHNKEIQALFIAPEETNMELSDTIEDESPDNFLGIE